MLSPHILNGVESVVFVFAMAKAAKGLCQNSDLLEEDTISYSLLCSKIPQ